MDSVERMSRSSLFEGIAFSDIEALRSQERELTYKSGDRLFKRGETARGLMILKEGLVELFIPIEIMGVTRDVPVETKQAGDVVAWSALVAPYCFTLGARCASDCLLTVLDREALEQFFSDRPLVGYLFMQNLAKVIGGRLQFMQTMWLRDLQLGAKRKLES